MIDQNFYLLFGKKTGYVWYVDLLNQRVCLPSQWNHKRNRPLVRQFASPTLQEDIPTGVFGTAYGWEYAGEPISPIFWWARIQAYLYVWADDRARWSSETKAIRVNDYIRRNNL